MMNLIRPRLVTFDVTGTLLMTALEVHYTEIGSLHGISMDSKKLVTSFKNNFHKLAQDHPIFGKTTGLGWQNWWRTIVYNVFRDQDKNSSEKTLDKVADHLIECYGTKKCWHKYPDTLKILNYLKKQDVVLGVISNFDSRLESVLVSTELRPYFSFVLTSYDFGSEKPDPTIFEEALRRSKPYSNTSIQPHEALHIGDTYDRDYLGAKNANWNAILIKRDSKQKIDLAKAPADDVFQNLDDVLVHLNSVFSKQDEKLC
ncbi:rhythmically expressed gene 2 protein-like [Athalia rosae]|uniref:rhythmically expressed gene 2 protein-like n=1 Tax=Athalia rosae TaxID=37344 RepID=UPI0020337627|nr:rhythmically expressed gene 2 protein-like [Athalia rosae]